MTATQTERYPHLLAHEGHVVPWVTRWTNERPTDAVQPQMTSEGIWIGYPTGNENRERTGILWQREGITRGGEPEYSQVSSYRQRACMTRCRCQVCGTKIEPNPTITWLFGAGQLEVLEDGTLVTMNPPVCEDCLPVALDVCPHLRKTRKEPDQRVVERAKGDLHAGHPSIYDVLEYRVWGVSGETFSWGGAGLLRKNHQLVSYDKDYPGLCKGGVLAKQMVVELTKYRLREVLDS